MSKLKPEIGQWYQDAAEDQLFEIVAIDESSGNIEIQYLDGEVSELDSDTWSEMILLTAEPPEDWRASYELSPEDEFDSDVVLRPGNHHDPLSSLDDHSYLDDIED